SWPIKSALSITFTGNDSVSNFMGAALDPAELTQIDQRVCQQLHPIMPLLDTFKSEQQAFEFIFPREAALNAHPQRMDGFVEEAFPSALRGLAVAGILFDIGDQAGIENAASITAPATCGRSASPDNVLVSMS